MKDTHEEMQITRNEMAIILRLRQVDFDLQGIYLKADGQCTIKMDQKSFISGDAHVLLGAIMSIITEPSGISLKRLVDTAIQKDAEKNHTIQ